MHLLFFLSQKICDKSFLVKVQRSLTLEGAPDRQQCLLPGKFSGLMKINWPLVMQREEATTFRSWITGEKWGIVCWVCFKADWSSALKQWEMFQCTVLETSILDPADLPWCSSCSPRLKAFQIENIASRNSANLKILILHNKLKKPATLECTSGFTA